MASSFEKLTAEQVRNQYRQRFFVADLTIPKILDAMVGDPDGLVHKDKQGAPLRVELPIWDDRPPATGLVNQLTLECKLSSSPEWILISQEDIPGPADFPDTNFPLQREIPLSIFQNYEGKFEFRFTVKNWNGASIRESPAAPVTIDRTGPLWADPEHAVIDIVEKPVITDAVLTRDNGVFCVIPDFIEAKRADVTVHVAWLDRVPLPTEDITQFIVFSRLGRQLSYTDVLGQQQTYRYDTKGRLEQTQLGTTASTFTYDAMGLTATITTTDSAGGQRVGITLKYDEFDREILRRFDLNGVIQELTQVYNDVDGLAQRTLKEGTVVLRDEVYGYDLRGRLTNYTCEGTQPPVDPYNKAITRQLFSFSELDNLRFVTTFFAGGSNRATYTYDTVDPTQLRIVKNTHADYPSEILLNYNADGHMILDEAGRTLEYNALGQLISVSSSSGGSSERFSYDPLNKLAGKNNGGAGEQRFYKGDKLANQVDGSNSSTYFLGDEVVLAELKGGADPKSLLLAGDHKNSVTSEVSKSGRKDIAYSAYGHRAQDASVSGSLGFNGERREEGTGWYLLGNGYRAFSTLLMRFMSPDSFSPFGAGGWNCYAYCDGDSINNVDPTGHFSWLARLFKLNTNSRGAQAIPANLREVPKGKPSAVLHKVTLNDIKGAGSIADAAGKKYDNYTQANQSHYDHYKKILNNEQKLKKVGALTNNAYGEKAEQYYKEHKSGIDGYASWIEYDKAYSDYEFLYKNQERKAITRLSSDRLTSYANADAALRKEARLNNFGNPPTQKQLRRAAQRVARTAGHVRKQEFEN
ncbi:MAG: RHS repeat-associated core domain-containing protein [Pseudomonas sp.]|uniref:RHS repeat-associated core domain-containing protein n=1 Tax=Pseudomonas sp. TaxID=306 RepID=UPI003D6F5258